jgi:hypothetical protein
MAFYGQGRRLQLWAAGYAALICGRLGDNQGVPAHLVPVPSYNTFHHRLRRLRGRASAHPCSAPGCEKQAAAWAWDHTGPFIVGLNGDKTVRYSLDISRYDPLCRQHHVERDALPRATVCGKGHEIPPERWRKHGCLECHAIRSKERYARLHGR